MKNRIGIILLSGLIFLFSSCFLTAAEQATDSRGKLRLEIFSGFSLVSPADFNQNVNYLKALDQFFYDDYFNYLKNLSALSITHIESWDKTQNSKLGSVKGVFPFGARLKYDVSRRFGLSLGLTYLSGGRTRLQETVYLRTHYSDKRDQETLIYDPFSASVSGMVPSLGLHYRIPIGGKLEVETYLSGGPLFARCEYSYARNYEWKVFYYISGVWNELPAMTDQLSLEQKGGGTGVSLEWAGRLNYRLSRKASLFIDAGYAYQKVSRISGKSRDNRNGIESNWEGVWQVKEERIHTEWGTLVTERPDNYWPEGNDFVSKGNFMLDLSGFVLKAGVGFFL